MPGFAVVASIGFGARATAREADGRSSACSDARTGEPTRVEHWVVAQRQGQVAARNILGHAEPFSSVPFFWTNQFDIAVRYVGHATAWDEVRVRGDVRARDCTIEYVKDDTMLATATVNRDHAALEAELAIEAASTGALHAQIS